MLGCGPSGRKSALSGQRFSPATSSLLQPPGPATDLVKGVVEVKVVVLVMVVGFEVVILALVVVVLVVVMVVMVLVVVVMFVTSLPTPHSCSVRMFW